MSSRLTTIVATNVSVAWGMLDGHKTTVADVVRAYVQSLLKTKDPTFVEFPRRLCPKRGRGMRRPCSRLSKSLYGHPEAGGHWERHLEVIVVRMGGQKVPTHPSCFFFPLLKLLLTIYVDDLLLSGPEENHYPFWRTLEKSVKIEPEEDLHRYLGRHRIFEAKDRLPYNLMAAFKSKTDA